MIADRKTAPPQPPMIASSGREVDVTAGATMNVFDVENCEDVDDNDVSGRDFNNNDDNVVGCMLDDCVDARSGNESSVGDNVVVCVVVVDGTVVLVFILDDEYTNIDIVSAVVVFPAFMSDIVVFTGAQNTSAAAGKCTPTDMLC